ncbi:MAG: HTTM domain-containing protein [Cytophagales bacterium]|nr:MAG: HTTM domain-containing protein [Cytophagales bacterium]
MAISTFIRFLLQPTSIAPLAVFRIVFGALMFFSTARFMAYNWVEEHFVKPIFHFKYFGFYWVEVLPAWAMYGLHWLMLLSALGILLGCFYRVSSILFFICFTYTELIDLTYYLNHYYFVSIVAALMCTLPAHAAYSLDAFWQKKSYTEVPFWTIGVLKLQLGIVYFYAGIAKINEDWLFEALPLRIWLPAHTDMWILGYFFQFVWVAYLFSWVGMLYDVFIPFLLNYKPTRWVAYMAVVIFHALTGLLFPIGVFPIVMIFSTLIFFSSTFHERLLHYLPTRFFGTNSSQNALKMPSWLLIIFCLHFSFQLLFPFRYLLYPNNNLFWTEEGYRFSWRVMLMEKAGNATFYVKDGCTGREGVVVNSDFLNLHQEKQMAMQPDMILQYAHFLAKHYAAQGICNPKVRAEVYVTLNGRVSKLLIDPHIDLTQLQDGWEAKKWLLPPP